MNKMINDLRVQEILIDITDDEENSVSIIECLLKGKTSDEEIAEETGIKLKIVRKVLYKLHDAGIATYKKKKDSITKWDIYNWKFEQKKLSNMISKKCEKSSAEIEKSIRYEEENMFFACKENGHRYKFEKASVYNFVCPKCGQSLEYHDNSVIIANLLKEKANYASFERITSQIKYID